MRTAQARCPILQRLTKLQSRGAKIGYSGVVEGVRPPSPLSATDSRSSACRQLAGRPVRQLSRGHLGQLQPPRPAAPGPHVYDAKASFFSRMAVCSVNAESGVHARRRIKAEVNGTVQNRSAPSLREAALLKTPFMTGWRKRSAVHKLW